MDEFVELFAFPPAIHIGLTEAQTALGQNARVGTRVEHLYVPGLLAVEDDSGTLQQPFDPAPGLKTIAT
ncbi:hypothetical protein D9M68_922430 [compost metagenome]